jgi:hypothetical protein
MTGQHEWTDCTGHAEVETMKDRQDRQDRHLEKTDTCVMDLKLKAARWEGAVGMLKWILGFAGLGSLTGIAGLIVNLAT